MNNQKTIARLEYLCRMISKYKNSWTETPSFRMTKWVDEYNDIRDTQYDVFCYYCKTNTLNVQLSIQHDAYDLLA
jgi:phage regulator Rha-like protein